MNFRYALGKFEKRYILYRIISCYKQIILKFTVLFNCFQFSLAFLLIGFILSVNGQDTETPGEAPPPVPDEIPEDDDMVNGQAEGKTII